MKNSRSLLLALSALLLSSLPALRAADQAGPDGPPPGERRERMADRMGEALGLTEDQKAKMKAIGDQERAEMQALRADATLAKEDFKTKGKAIHEKYKAQRDAILTPEQKAKADKFREKGRERWEKGGPGGPGGERRKERREKAGE